MTAELSLLCYTSRPQFLPWLTCEVAKQKATLGARLEVLIYQVEASVPETCNRLLAAARAPYLAWMADDDWHHPNKLHDLLAVAKGTGRAWVGYKYGWFVPVAAPTRCVGYNGAFPPPASSVYRTEVAKGFVFDEARPRASDTQWMKAMERRIKPLAIQEVVPHSVWCCHGQNMSDRSYKFEERTPSVFEETTMADDVLKLAEEVL